jgi:hypothetical protein
MKLCPSCGKRINDSELCIACEIKLNKKGFDSGRIVGFHPRTNKQIFFNTIGQAIVICISIVFLTYLLLFIQNSNTDGWTITNISYLIIFTLIIVIGCSIWGIIDYQIQIKQNKNPPPINRFERIKRENAIWFVLRDKLIKNKELRDKEARFFIRTIGFNYLLGIFMSIVLCILGAWLFFVPIIFWGVSLLVIIVGLVILYVSIIGFRYYQI